MFQQVPCDVAEAIRLYEDGMTLMEVGERLGCSWMTIQRHLKASGVQIRKVGSRRSNLVPEDRRKAKLAYAKKRRDAISLRPHDGPAHGLKWQDIAKRDHMRCKICGRKVNASDKWLSERGRWCFGRTYPTIDHIIPLANGGTDTYDNVQLTCKRCNSKKQHKGQMRLAI
jgi:5-methylcytosine-specific restriction endonuclease McrA